MGIYAGQNSVAKKVKNIYVGVNGVARKVSKVYIGVNGVARLCYSSFPDAPSAYNLIGTYTFSGKFTAPEDGWFQIELQGASGYGGTSALSSYLYGGGGGGGGGCAISRVKMKKGDTVVYSLGTAVENSTNNNQAKANDSTSTINSSFNEYDHTMTVTGATNGSKAFFGSTGKGGAGGVGSGGNYANYTGKTGSNGKEMSSSSATGAAGGAAGYTGGNAGGAGAKQAGADQSLAGAGSKAFIKIYRGNTNLI